jgi:hypothetical protein
MTFLPRRQRTLCRECLANVYGPPESYTFENWPASTCRRSRRWHRRQAALRQPGTTCLYRRTRERRGVNVTATRDTCSAAERRRRGVLISRPCRPACVARAVAPA